MKSHSWLIWAVTAVLVACTIAVFVTGDANSTQDSHLQTETGNNVLNTKLLTAAHQLASVADTTDEQSLANEALRLADHEFDQAYATELRQAATAAPRPTPEFKQLADRIAALKAKIASEHDQ